MLVGGEAAGLLRSAGDLHQPAFEFRLRGLGGMALVVQREVRL